MSRLLETSKEMLKKDHLELNSNYCNASQMKQTQSVSSSCLIPDIGKMNDQECCLKVERVIERLVQGMLEQIHMQNQKLVLSVEPSYKPRSSAEDMPGNSDQTVHLHKSTVSQIYAVNVDKSAISLFEPTVDKKNWLHLPEIDMFSCISNTKINCIFDDESSRIIKNVNDDASSSTCCKTISNVAAALLRKPCRRHAVYAVANLEEEHASKLPSKVPSAFNIIDELCDDSETKKHITYLCNKDIFSKTSIEALLCKKEVCVKQSYTNSHTVKFSSKLPFNFMLEGSSCGCCLKEGSASTSSSHSDQGQVMGRKCNSLNSDVKVGILQGSNYSSCEELKDVSLIPCNIGYENVSYNHEESLNLCSEHNVSITHCSGANLNCNSLKSNLIVLRDIHGENVLMPQFSLAKDHTFSPGRDMFKETISLNGKIEAVFSMLSVNLTSGQLISSDKTASKERCRAINWKPWSWSSINKAAPVQNGDGSGFDYNEKKDRLTEQEVPEIPLTDHTEAFPVVTSNHHFRNMCLSTVGRCCPDMNLCRSDKWIREGDADDDQLSGEDSMQTKHCEEICDVPNSCHQSFGTTRCDNPHELNAKPVLSMESDWVNCFKPDKFECRTETDVANSFAKNHQWNSANAFDSDVMSKYSSDHFNLEVTSKDVDQEVPSDTVDFSQSNALFNLYPENEDVNTINSSSSSCGSLTELNESASGKWIEPKDVLEGKPWLCSTTRVERLERLMPLQTCRRRRRLGLSRKQKVPPLHPRPHPYALSSGS